MIRHVKYPIFAILSFLMILRCSNEIDIKVVKGMRCTDCQSVLSAETTVTVMNKEQVKEKYVKTPAGNFLYEYKDTLCASCVEEKKYRQRNNSNKAGKHTRGKTTKPQSRNSSRPTAWGMKRHFRG